MDSDLLTPPDSKQQLDLLTKEYELAIKDLDALDTRLIQVIGVGVTALSLVSAYLLKNLGEVPYELALVAPLVFVVFFAIFITTIHFAHGAIWNFRILLTLV